MRDIAVSSCLLGNLVRYDAKEQKSEFILQTLSKKYNLIPLCPEVIVFGVPRDKIELYKTGSGKTSVRLVKNHKDVNEKLKSAVESEIKRLKEHNIVAFILKSKSPSCGLGTTKLFSGNEIIDYIDGVFAKRAKEEFKEARFFDENSILEANL
jgi:uncharacterized protein YbbK (DUF523 family)